MIQNDILIIVSAMTVIFILFGINFRDLSWLNLVIPHRLVKSYYDAMSTAGRDSQEDRDPT
jgi:hypothetical protein